MTANRIKELRTNRKMTQKELADKLKLSQSHIAMLEKGERSLDIDLMAAISKELGVKPYELLPQEWQPEEISPEEREILRMIRKTAAPQAADNRDIPPSPDSQANTKQQTPSPFKPDANGR